jgi:hypothetical protein
MHECQQFCRFRYHRPPHCLLNRSHNHNDNIGRRVRTALYLGSLLNQANSKVQNNESDWISLAFRFRRYKTSSLGQRSSRTTGLLFVPRHSHAISQFTLTHTANINMAVTRSQRPKPGSPITAAPAEPAPVKTAPAISKKPPKPKEKAEKKTTAATGQKPAKVRKRKIPKRKGPKSASKEHSETSPQAISKPSSEASLIAIAGAVLGETSNSDALFNPGVFTPELLEQLGLAYVDIPSFTASASDPTTHPKSKLKPHHTYVKTGPRVRNGKPLPAGFYSHPHLFPEHWDEGPPFGAHDTVKRANPPPASPQAVAMPGAFARTPSSARDQKSTRPQSEPAHDILDYPSEAPHPTIWASPTSPSFGAQRSATSKSSPVKRVFFATPHPSAVSSPTGKGSSASHGSNQLSPRGVQAGGALLDAVETPVSSPMDFLGLFSHGNFVTRATVPVNPSNEDEGTTNRPIRSPNTVVRDIVEQVEQQPASPPPHRPARLRGTQTGGLFGSHPSEAVRNADDEAEEEEPPESPVSVNNAQVFKRPTVADVRRERTQMHDELRGLVESLRSARDELNGVIGVIETRMDVLKAVNRMQKGLRNAPLGRGRGRGRGR